MAVTSPTGHTDWANGAKAIREAHRYCTAKEHGGHDFEDCPMWRAYVARTDLEAAVLFGPIGLTFPNLPHYPTGPDVLDALAAGLDRQDDKAEAAAGFLANRDVQAYLREWASRLRAAIAQS